MTKIEQLRAYFQARRIVKTEMRHGDGRNWDESYEVQRDVSDEELAQIVDICAGRVE